MGALAYVSDSRGKVHILLRSSEDDPKTSLNQHQSLSGEILSHFDILEFQRATRASILAPAECCVASGKDEQIHV